MKHYTFVVYTHYKLIIYTSKIRTDAKNDITVHFQRIGSSLGSNKGVIKVDISISL